MSPAVTGPGPFLCRRSSAESRVWLLSATDFRFRRMSTTSSCTPSIEVYSCSTPSISTSVMAVPGMDDSSTRRSALPRVWPKPRSNGSITTRAWRGATGCTLTTRGLRNSLTEPCIALTLPAQGPAQRKPRRTGLNGGARPRFQALRLLRIQLDDQVLVDVRQHVIAPRGRLEHPAELLGAHVHPVRQPHLGGHVHGALDAQLLARLLAHLDAVAGLHLVGGDGHRLLVHGDRLVAHQLARLGARGGEAHAVHDVVQAALEQPQQVLARGAGLARRFLVVVAELPLQHPVHAAQLLLLAQLRTVIGQALTALALDAARRHGELALVLERLDATLEEQIGALAAGELAGGTGITRHRFLVQTRRFFGGRHPLCGIGVTSEMLVIFSPQLLSARTADSRPGPGPPTRTSTFFTPCSCAATPAFSAAASGRPRQRVALTVGDSDDRVVEGRMHVRDRIQHVLARLLGLLGRRRRRRAARLGFLLSHSLCLSGGCVQLDRLLARTLAGARVGTRALTAHRESAPMADAPPGSEVHEALDVHRGLAPQI